MWMKLTVHQTDFLHNVYLCCKNSSQEMYFICELCFCSKPKDIKVLKLDSRVFETFQTEEIIEEEKDEREGGKEEKEIAINGEENQTKKRKGSKTRKYKSIN